MSLPHGRAMPGPQTADATARAGGDAPMAFDAEALLEARGLHAYYGAVTSCTASISGSRAARPSGSWAATAWAIAR